MRIKTIMTAVFLVGIATLTVHAQTPLDQLSNDLQTIFDELGEDIVPNLQTASVLNHGLGSAELGDFPRMYVSLSAGATVAPGVLEFTDDEEKFENFSLINTFLDEAGLNDASVRNVTDNYAPYPSLRASFGIGLVGGYEIDLQAGILPSGISGVIPVDGVTAGITTIGTRVRKVIVQQQPGLPAVSVGVGYVFSSIGFGYDLDELDPIETGSTELDLNGDLVFEAMTHSFGVDARASTRFLRISYPFIGVSGYFQRTTYKAGVDGFSANIDGSPNETEPAIEPLSEQEFNDFNLVVNAGSDIKLAIVNLFIHLNYAIDTRAYGGILGMRIQI
jgi:hypothetical protein